ncbi:hypothetical protein SLT67_04590 [Paenibacillus illinoisensis]|uniref:hypothetical protein n=1 Tax=Paenibacillus illinoisensis TaxID=59845 RepID=UPI003CE7231B
MTNKDEYFYCYSFKLFKFLRMDMKVNYICSGLHEKSLDKFWQFRRTEELDGYLKVYSQRYKEIN